MEHPMSSYMIGSPSGWRGETFDAESDDAAVARVEAGGDPVPDLMDWQDEDGRPVTLLVVADETAGSDPR
jgi:hypothetical protein